MELLRAFLPPWLSPTILTLILGLAGGAISGGWVVSEWDSVAYSRLEASKGKLEAEYEAFKARTAANAAKANADGQKERDRLQMVSEALERQLIETQKVADEKSAQLRTILKNSKPGDAWPLGPTVRAYLDGVRGN